MRPRSTLVAAVGLTFTVALLTACTTAPEAPAGGAATAVTSTFGSGAAASPTPARSQESPVQACFDAWRDAGAGATAEGHFESRYSLESTLAVANGDEWHVTLIPHTAPEAEWNLYCVVSDDGIRLLDPGYEPWPTATSRA